MLLLSLERIIFCWMNWKSFTAIWSHASYSFCMTVIREKVILTSDITDLYSPMFSETLKFWSWSWAFTQLNFLDYCMYQSSLFLSFCKCVPNKQSNKVVLSNWKKYLWIIHMCRRISGSKKKICVFFKGSQRGVIANMGVWSEKVII